MEDYFRTLKRISINNRNNNFQTQHKSKQKSQKPKNQTSLIDDFQKSKSKNPNFGEGLFWHTRGPYYPQWFPILLLCFPIFSRPKKRAKPPLPDLLPTIKLKHQQIKHKHWQSAINKYINTYTHIYIQNKNITHHQQHIQFNS